MGEIQNQYKPTFNSIPLNIAEGAGKQSGQDQARFYDNARGSTLERAACLDVLVAMQLVLPQKIESGKEQVAEIVAMPTSLVKRLAGDRVKEETVSYLDLLFNLNFSLNLKHRLTLRWQREQRKRSDKP